jgi:carbon storage regulator CsrA
MLILERRQGQIIRINNDLIMIVKEINVRNKIVRLAFDAPIKYQIYREEVYRRMQENAES